MLKRNLITTGSLLLGMVFSGLTLAQTKNFRTDLCEFSFLLQRAVAPTLQLGFLGTKWPNC